MAGLRLSAIRASGTGNSYQVLNARNGKPVTNECVNVFIEGMRTPIVVPTDKEGLAILHVEGERAGGTDAERGWECNDMSAVHPKVGASDATEIAGDYYVGCQQSGRMVPGEPVSNPLTNMPPYPIKTRVGCHYSQYLRKIQGRSKAGRVGLLRSTQLLGAHEAIR